MPSQDVVRDEEYVYPNTGARPVPWKGPLARIRGSVLLRRLVPMPVMVGGARLAFAVLHRLRPGRLAACRSVVEAIVGGTPAEQRLAELGARYSVARVELEELPWRPWKLAAVPVEGFERVLAARAEGRGLLLSYTHYGPLLGRIRMTNQLRPVYSPVGDWFLEPPRAGYAGYWYEHIRQLTSDNGGRAVRAKGSRESLAALLRAGQVVNLAMDMPGGTPTTFLGKPVEMTAGSARLADETGCLVLPVTLRSLGRNRWQTVVGEVMDPAAFPSWRELHQALADWHSGAILAAPEYYENPGRGGAWAVADRTGWRRAPAQP